MRWVCKLYVFVVRKLYQFMTCQSNLSSFNTFPVTNKNIKQLTSGMASDGGNCCEHKVRR